MIFYLIIFLIISCVLTALVRRYALHKALLDIPNERSSHVLPTPRGGGLAIVITFFLGVGYLFVSQQLSMNISLALLGGILVAAIGYYDDVKKLSARYRALFHLLAAIWAIYWLGGFPYLTFGLHKIHVGWLGAILAVIAVIWCINLYNFMDGIDGFAGSEGVFISFCAATLLWIKGDGSLAMTTVILAAAIGGFLVWNWPPAKIFMGDVGSGFLGFIFAVIALASMNRQEGSLFFWALLFAIFLFDATLTLIYRVWRKQAWYEAHREHAFQKFVISGLSHRQVTLALIVMNILILCPAAFLTLYMPNVSFWLFGVVAVGLVVLWAYSRRIMTVGRTKRSVSG